MSLIRSSTIPAFPAMKRARGAVDAGAHNDTDPKFTVEMAKMLSAYAVMHGELPSTDSIPSPRVFTALGDLPTRSLANAERGLLTTKTLHQDIPLAAGFVLHLDASVDTSALSFTAKVTVSTPFKFIGDVTIGNCSIGLPGQRCEFGYKSILHAALYMDGRSLKLDVDIAGNHSTITIISL